MHWQAIPYSTFKDSVMQITKEPIDDESISLCIDMYTDVRWLSKEVFLRRSCHVDRQKLRDVLARDTSGSTRTRQWTSQQPSTTSPETSVWMLTTHPSRRTIWFEHDCSIKTKDPSRLHVPLPTWAYSPGNGMETGEKPRTPTQRPQIISELATSSRQRASMAGTAAVIFITMG